MRGWAGTCSGPPRSSRRRRGAPLLRRGSGAALFASLRRQWPTALGRAARSGAEALRGRPRTRAGIQRARAPPLADLDERVLRAERARHDADPRFVADCLYDEDGVGVVEVDAWGVAFGF